MIEWGHGCAFCFGVNRLCSEIGQGLMLGSTDGWGCRLCFVAGQYNKLGIEAAQHHCSGLLFIWSQRLCSAVEWDWVIEWPLCLMWSVGLEFKSGRTANQALWPGEATSLALQRGRAAGWDLCLRAAVSRNVTCQDLSAGYLLSLLLSGPQWLSSKDSPVILMR